MPASLYDYSVACYLQTLTGVTGFLEKGAAHCASAGLDPQEIVAARIHPDMNPFPFQIVSVVHHSLGAINGVKAGVFGPPAPVGTLTYADLQAMVANARTELAAMKPDDINALEGRDVIFQIRDMKMPFTVEGFILSFSLPNLHFHATTAYDLLRAKGVSLGKRDYLGGPRLKS